MDGEFIGGQLKAARKLKGVRTTRVLAKRIDRARFGEKVIGQIERDQRPAQEHEIAWLADALDVPPSYLTDPVASEPDSPALTIEGELAGILSEIKAQLKQQTDVLEEIRGHAQAAERMLAEQRKIKDETDEHLRRLGRAVVEGHAEETSDPPPVLEQPSAEEKKAAASRRTPSRP